MLYVKKPTNRRLHLLLEASGIASLFRSLHEWTYRETAPFVAVFQEWMRQELVDDDPWDEEINFVAVEANALLPHQLVEVNQPVATKG